MTDAVSPMVLSQEQIHTAMQSPDHLRHWLDASGRRWLVLNALELVEALPWPTGVDAFMQVVMAYRDHRRTIESGRHELVEDHTTGVMVEVPVCKDEELEVEELDRAIRYLVGQMRERMPEWSLEESAL